MPSKTKFTVTLRTSCNPETGETFILYTDRELEERNKVLLADLEERIAGWPTIADDKEAQEQQKQAGILSAAIRAEIDARTARQKAERDIALPDADTQDFTIFKPTWFEHLDALGKANVLNEDTGQSTFSEDIYVRELLPMCIEGMLPKDVGALDTTIAGELRFRFLRSISPNQNRLPFTAPLPATS